jgi:hypothetical protein
VLAVDTAADAVLEAVLAVLTAAAD